MLVVSQHQSKGIGRISKRQWISQWGGLYFSFLSVFGESVRREISSKQQQQSVNEAIIEEIFLFRMCVAVAMVECAREALRYALYETKLDNSAQLSPDNLILKWPNDLYYLNGKEMYKVGGMLMDNEFVTTQQNQQAETRSQQETMPMKMKMKMKSVQQEEEELPQWMSLGDDDQQQQTAEKTAKVKCFTGIGINVNQKEWNKHFPEGESLSGLMQKAMSDDSTLYEFELERVLAGFFNSLNKWLHVSDKKHLIEQYKKVLGGTGQMVKVMPQRKENSNVYYMARVEDISTGGNLIVRRTDTGEKVELVSEEVSLRPVSSEE